MAAASSPTKGKGVPGAITFVADNFAEQHKLLEDEAIALSRTVVCYKCRTACDPFKCVIKNKSSVELDKANYVCRACNSVSVMLLRHMAWPPPMFAQLSDEQQRAFWVSCKETAEPDSRFTYSKVKATLVKTLTRGHGGHLLCADEKDIDEGCDCHNLATHSTGRAGSEGEKG